MIYYVLPQIEFHIKNKNLKITFNKKNQTNTTNKYSLKKYLSKIKSLIEGYESVKKISSREKSAINVLCRGAALRYLLTRLYDYTNTPKTALIKIKNPKVENRLEGFKIFIVRNGEFICMFNEK